MATVLEPKLWSDPGEVLYSVEISFFALIVLKLACICISIAFLLDLYWNCLALAAVFESKLQSDSDGTFEEK